ncbi:MAG: hypothetical protein ACLFS9_09570, partial [Nitriliruptoraceae bacterium]
MSVDALEQLAGRCAGLAADGTDPQVLAVLLAWTVRPRRSFESLRRRVLEEGRGWDVVDPRAPGTAGGVGARLAARIRPEVDAADVVAAASIVQRWLRRGCRLAVVGDPAYPSRLAEGWPSTDGPVLLASTGTLPDAPACVALVGARRASAY